eukprot:11172755-Lingulodinium_polyedra.AAC.1
MTWNNLELQVQPLDMAPQPMQTKKNANATACLRNTACTQSRCAQRLRSLTHAPHAMGAQQHQR